MEYQDHKRNLKSIVEKLEPYAAKKEQILLGYLFGSTARGEARSDSDIDIAFLLKKIPTDDDRISLTSELIELVENQNIDVVLLNDATPIVRHEVVSDGILFFARDQERSNQFETEVYREYFDTDFLRKVQNDYLMESISGASS